MYLITTTHLPSLVTGWSACCWLLLLLDNGPSIYTNWTGLGSKGARFTGDGANIAALLSEQWKKGKEAD